MVKVEDARGREKAEKNLVVRTSLRSIDSVGGNNNTCRCIRASPLCSDRHEPHHKAWRNHSVDRPHVCRFGPHSTYGTTTGGWKDRKEPEISG